MAVAQRMYARALFEAARDEGGSRPWRRISRSRCDARGRARAGCAFLRNPQVEPAGGGGARADLGRRRRACFELRPARRGEGVGAESSRR